MAATDGRRQSSGKRGEGKRRERERERERERKHEGNQEKEGKKGPRRWTVPSFSSPSIFIFFFVPLLFLCGGLHRMEPSLFHSYPAPSPDPPIRAVFSLNLTDSTSLITSPSLSAFLSFYRASSKFVGFYCLLPQPSIKAKSLYVPPPFWFFIFFNRVPFTNSSASPFSFYRCFSHFLLSVVSHRPVTPAMQRNKLRSLKRETQKKERNKNSRGNKKKFNMKKKNRENVLAVCWWQVLRPPEK